MLINEIFSRPVNEGVNDPHIFKAIALIGPPGAGKSTVAQKLVGGSGLRVLNTDSFTEMFAKKGELPTGHMSPEQSAKAWKAMQSQKANWIDGRLGIILDGTGRNLDNVQGPLQELSALGYDNLVILVNVSLATSISRQKSREKAQAAQYGQGRNVELPFAMKAYQQVQTNIPRLRELYGNRLIVIDNETAPDLSGPMKIVNNFLSAPPSKPAAVQWIKSQKGGEQVAAKAAAYQQKTPRPAPQQGSTPRQQPALPAANPNGFNQWSSQYKE